MLKTDEEKIGEKCQGQNVYMLVYRPDRTTLYTYTPAPCIVQAPEYHLFKSSRTKYQTMPQTLATLKAACKPRTPVFPP